MPDSDTSAIFSYIPSYIHTFYFANIESKSMIVHSAVYTLDSQRRYFVG